MNLRIKIVVVLTFALFVAQGGCAEMTPGDFTLRLPHALKSDETALVEVRVGKIGPGQEIEITTSAGQTLGVISPFAVRAGQPAGTYTLPLPTGVIEGNRLDIRLQLTQSNAKPRAPSNQEVLGVRVIIQELPEPEK